MRRKEPLDLPPARRRRDRGRPILAVLAVLALAAFLAFGVPRLIR